MTKVFLVTHVHEELGGEEDVKIIGIFTSDASARTAVDRAKQRPGFSEAIDGFHIDAYELDKEQWVEGFVSWNPPA